MTIQNFSTSLCLFSLVDTCSFTCLVSCRPYDATSLDYGFDFDQDELARELSSPLPPDQDDQSIFAVEADEFEVLYNWFNS
jgi:hypothetical protein